MLGVEEPQCRIHAPNESVDPGELRRTALAEALLQADLTAVVPGVPAPALADLLRRSATLESCGGAAVFRGVVPDAEAHGIGLLVHTPPAVAASARVGQPVELVGVDCNPRSQAAAAATASNGLP